MHLNVKISLLMTTLLTCACLKPSAEGKREAVEVASDAESDPPNPTASDALPTPEEALPTMPSTDEVAPTARQGLSIKNNVRFKLMATMEADLSAALSLTSDEICTELGEINCMNGVHRLALGGTEPYDAGVFLPLTESAPTTPIVWERVVLSGCHERAQRDLSGEKIIFDPKDRTASIINLYQRVLKRTPTPLEIDELLSFHKQVSATASAEADLQWAMLACYLVTTSIENVFY